MLMCGGLLVVMCECRCAHVWGLLVVMCECRCAHVWGSVSCYV